MTTMLVWAILALVPLTSASAAPSCSRSLRGMAISGTELQRKFDIYADSKTKSVCISSLTVTGPLDLRLAELPFSLRLSHVHFRGKVFLDQAVFKRDLRIEYSIFDATVAGRIDVAGDANIEGTTFYSNVSLKEMKVGQGLSLSGSVFYQEALFDAAHVGETLSADGARFMGDTHFLLSKVGRNFSLEGTTFALAGSSKDPKADLSWMRVAGEVRLRGAWAHKESVKLLGMEFGSISADDKPAEWTNLERFLGEQEYFPDIYSKTEKTFHDSGRFDLADDVHISSRWREGTAARNNADYITNRLIGILMGYGRRPMPILVLDTFIIVFAWLLLFRDSSNMRLRSAHPPRHGYGGLWYSIDLFIPFVDLGPATTWEPQERPRIRIFGFESRILGRLMPHYVHVHRLLGWLLVPLTVAAVSGLVK